MSMTPGPWRYIAAHRGFIIEASDKCYDIAVVRDIGKEDNEANARAIAALPDLVEALKQYEKAFDDLFASCASNGIFNAWGKSVNCLNLNEAHQKAENALNKAGVTHD